jgi:hypothetical protein
MENTQDLKRQNDELTAEVGRLKNKAQDLAAVTLAYQESQSRFRAVFLA